MRAWVIKTAAALIACLCALAAAAQETLAPAATLIADSVEILENRTLLARGSVEILLDQTRITAQEVRYDGENDRLTITGPITLRDGAGTVILAAQAEISDNFQDAVLRSARAVLDAQLQIAAVEINRRTGIYLEGHKIAATSCQVCDSGRAPLWQIRARRLVHDEIERQLYFEDAQFRVLDVPILYFPRLRLPDPTLDRATGVLTPRLESSTLLGWGAKLPYFIVLGDNRDLLLTPYLTNKTRTLETRYRHLWPGAELETSLYLSDDAIRTDGFRWGLIAEGTQELPLGYDLTFAIEAASDKSYLSDYSYSDTDRRENSVAVSRATAQTVTQAELLYIESLRTGEDTDVFPALHFYGGHAVRLGRHGLAQIDTHAYYRRSSDGSDADLDGIGDGLDSVRLSGGFDWARSAAIGAGIIAEAKAEFGGDVFFLADDDARDSTETRLRGGAALGLRWPFERRNANGSRDIIEPRLQLSHSDATDADIPNEDSTRVEIDEGNLFSLNRAPGSGFYEEGTRVELALSWTRINPDGWDGSLSFGRIERLSGANAFSTASGLSSDVSSWLVSGNLDAGPVDLIGRLSLDTDFHVSKSEFSLGYTSDRLALLGGYAFLAADAQAGRTVPAEEMALDASYQFNDQVGGSGGLRYDFDANFVTSAELGLTYLNQCVEFGLSVSRNFAASANVASSTDVSITVRLRGFGTSSASGRQINASCR
ncbi:MAG: LPS assembly protein LptD [Pseudomonadota bacterium]